MNNISLPSGVQEYNINGRAVLRFSPADPTIYSRFTALIKNIEAVGEEIAALTASNSGPEAVLNALQCFDRRIKEHLTEAFGKDNDFDAIFDGCSVFTFADTGEWVITEFINAIRPIIEQETGKNLEKKAAAARANRQQRRTQQR